MDWAAHPACVGQDSRSTSWQHTAPSFLPAPVSLSPFPLWSSQPSVLMRRTLSFYPNVSFLSVQPLFSLESLLLSVSFSLSIHHSFITPIYVSVAAPLVISPLQSCSCFTGPPLAALLASSCHCRAVWSGSATSVEGCYHKQTGQRRRPDPG